MRSHARKRFPGVDRWPTQVPKITAEFISDYAAGRLDAEDAQVVEDAINQD
jgi:hypothetical protein